MVLSPTKWDPGPVDDGFVNDKMASRPGIWGFVNDSQVYGVLSMTKWDLGPVYHGGFGNDKMGPRPGIWGVCQ